MVENENRASNTKEVKASNTESKSLTDFDIFLLVSIGILSLILLSYLINKYKKADNNWILFTFTINSFVSLIKGLASLLSFSPDSSSSEGGSRKSKKKTKRKSKRKLYKNKKTNKNAMKNKK